MASVGGASERPAALRLRVAGVELARTLASPGDLVVLSGTLRNTGWTMASVELDPDELRADDRRVLALFRAEPAQVSSVPEVGHFLEEALSVLQQGGRAASGDQVSVGRVSQTGVSVVFPPSDPAMVGALNRTLDARDVAWQFEEPAVGEWALSDESGTAEGIEVYRRYRLNGTGDVFASVSGEPWLVRSGNVVLVASRMEPGWTRLPVSASFVPFVDYLVNRIAAEQSWIVMGRPGETVELPMSARTMVGSQVAEVTTVPSSRQLLVPQQTGVYFLRGAAGDTVGALEVNADVRESQLRVADENQLRVAFGEESQILESSPLLRGLFGGEGRLRLTGLFLIATLVAVVGEFVVASSGGRTRTAG